jgi:hypothetical protein
MIQWPFKIWREAQRRVDLTTLWPECKKYSHDLEHAKAAFYYHAVRDPAWTRDYTETELIDFVDELQ